MKKLWLTIRNFFYAPSAPLFEIGDGVRIKDHPEDEYIGQVGTIIDTNDDSEKYHGRYQIDVKSIWTWVYCTGWELERLSASERLFYGV